jgi:hypothetical protein
MALARLMTDKIQISSHRKIIGDNQDDSTDDDVDEFDIEGIYVSGEEYDGHPTWVRHGQSAASFRIIFFHQSHFAGSMWCVSNMIEDRSCAGFFSFSKRVATDCFPPEGCLLKRMGTIQNQKQYVLEYVSSEVLVLDGFLNEMGTLMLTLRSSAGKVEAEIDVDPGMPFASMHTELTRHVEGDPRIVLPTGRLLTMADEALHLSELLNV